MSKQANPEPCPPNESADLLTIEEASQLLRMPKSWLYERTRQNEVPHFKLGKYLRFDRGELLHWREQFRRDGKGRRLRIG